MKKLINSYPVRRINRSAVTPTAAQTVIFEDAEPSIKLTNISNSSHPRLPQKTPFANPEKKSRIHVTRSDPAKTINKTIFYLIN